MEEDFMCFECNLKFSTQAVLDNHKKKFCTVHQGCDSSSAVNKSSKKDTDFKSYFSKDTPLDCRTNMQSLSLSTDYNTILEDLKMQASVLESNRKDLLTELEYKGLGTTTAETVTATTPLQVRTLRATQNPVSYNIGNVGNEENSNLKNLWLDLQKRRFDYEKEDGDDQKLLECFQHLETLLSKYNRERDKKEGRDFADRTTRLDTYKNAGLDSTSQLGVQKWNQANTRNWCNQYGSLKPLATRDEFSFQKQDFCEEDWLNRRKLRQRFHEQRLYEMYQETDLCRQQLELERIQQDLSALRGHRDKPVLPSIKQQTQLLRPSQAVIGRRLELETVRQNTNEAVFHPTPYDPSSGFCVFLDFISTGGLFGKAVCLATQLYDQVNVKINSTCLPCVSCTPTDLQTTFSDAATAVIGVKQHVPDFYPSASALLCMCLQTGHDQDDLRDIGWCKVGLFDQYNQLMSGRWKIPVRSLPVRPELDVAAINSIPQVQSSTVYLRLINTRDCMEQEHVILDPRLMSTYRFLPAERHPNLQPHIINPCSHQRSVVEAKRVKSYEKEVIEQKGKDDCGENRTKRNSIEKNQLNVNQKLSEVGEKNVKGDTGANSFNNLQNRNKIEIVKPTEKKNRVTKIEEITEVSQLIFQIDKIIGVSDGSVKMKITLFGPDGKVATCATGKVYALAEAVCSFFLAQTQCFDLQTFVFDKVNLYTSSILVLEIFEQSSGENNESLAWTACPIDEQKEVNSELSLHQRLTSNQLLLELQLRLFKGSVLKITDIITRIKNNTFETWVESIPGAYVFMVLCNDSALKTKQPRDVTPTHLLEQNIPPNVFISCKRTPPGIPFKDTDGFDVYVDAGRYFPQCTAATRVTVEIHSGAASKRLSVEQFWESFSDINSCSIHPSFNARFEFRDHTFEPQSKLLFTVNVIDDITKGLSVLGRSVVPLFVEPDTFEPANGDTSVFCLNSGCMQLRLYQDHLEDVQYDERKLNKKISCCTVLVRVLQAACYNHGEPKKASDFDDDEWISEGILVQAPDYKDGLYDSSSCLPTLSEIQFFRSFSKLGAEDMKSKLETIVPRGSKPHTEKALLDWLNVQFKVQGKLPFFNRRFLIQYSGLYGFSVCVESAQNMYWSGLTVATVCISPPSSFYLGSTLDPPQVCTELNIDSYQRHPEWTKEEKVFAQRRYSANLAVLVHLYEVIDQEGRLKVGDQAWTVLPLFVSGYLATGVYQLPFFKGAPSKLVVDKLQVDSLMPTLTTFRKKKVLKVIDGPSVCIRINDLRLSDVDRHRQMIVNRQFLPQSDKFMRRMESKLIRSLLPIGVDGLTYVRMLIDSFKKTYLNI